MGTTDKASTIAAAVSKGVAAVTDAFASEVQLGGSDAIPDEEQLTALLWQATYPPLIRVKFDRYKEAQHGADWLWWFVGADGLSFGLLVQAKTLRGTPGARRIGFEQANQQGRQDHALRESADILEVPAFYVIYFGPPAYRPDLIRDEGGAEWKGSNADMAVGMLDLAVYSTVIRPSLAGGFGLVSPEAQDTSLGARRNEAAVNAFNWSCPLIHLTSGASSYLWPRLAHMYPAYQAVWDKLAEENSGPATVAKAIMEYLTYFRQATNLLAAAEKYDVTEQPRASHHSGRPYILRGLRTAPPAYVQDIIEGRDHADLPAGVRGAVVVADAP